MTASTTMTEGTAAPQEGPARKTRPPGVASPRLQERLEREARARRALFVASVTGLAATLGLVAISAGAPQVNDPAQPAISSAPRGQRVVAEIPIQSASGQDGATIVRIVAPAQDAPAPDLRTRATP